jgi:MFS family permease
MHAMRALGNRNLRLYFAGQAVSLIGTWMQQMALSWLVYRLTNSAAMLGLIGFISQLPAFFLMPFAGILADRTNRHKMVVVTQTCAFIQSTLLALLVLSGKAEFWSLAALGAVMGIISAFDIPTRQTFIIDMVKDRDEVQQAIAMNSSMVTVTRLIGPALAGFLISLVGEGMCFALNAASYIAVIAALLFIKVARKQKVHPGASAPVFQQLKEGFVYAFSFRTLRALILLMAFISLFGTPYTTLLPAFAKDRFVGDATTLGFLSTASGVGSLAGAVLLASRKNVLGLGRFVLIACAVFGAGLVGFALSHNLWLSLGLLTLAGFGMIVQMASSNTLIQTIVEEDKRGRVMSIYTMAFMGLAPFGSLLAGAVAGKIGIESTILISGIMCLLAAAAFASRIKYLRQEVLPIYIERGILSAENELKIVNN